METNSQDHRKKRTLITAKIIKDVQLYLNKELNLKQIAKECGISYTAARNIVSSISKGKQPVEILSIKKEDGQVLTRILKASEDYIGSRSFPHFVFIKRRNI